MQNSNKSFAQNLKKLRSEAGLNQNELAERISYTAKAISKWETGTALPPSNVLPLLAQALGTDLNSLFNYRDKATYYLGIDGGGTKTRFMLADSDGNILNSITLPASNPTSVGIDETVNILKDGFKQILNVPYNKISVFAGIAGCGIASNSEYVLNELASYNFSKLVVVSDAENVISAGLKGSDGIISIMGTGSATFISKNGKRTRIGGYGHIIGDVFSGAEFGRAAIESALYHLDGSGDKTAITQEILSRVDNIEDLPNLISAKGKTYLASFADIVFKCAEQGDAIASKILDRNIKRLARQLSAALDNFDGTVAIPIVLAGGITNMSNQFLDKLNQSIISKCPRKIKILKEEPVTGAVLAAGVLVKENNNA